MWRIDGEGEEPRALGRPGSNTTEEVSTMIGSLSAYSYGSGGSGGAYWLLVIVVAAVVIAAGTWLFLRMRGRRAHHSPGPPSTG
jgi:hypothetical protein